jgi:16S rRNA (guanine(1405)-N(7))-methyltransferase
MLEAPINQLELLVTAVRTSPKYRNIAPNFIKRIGEIELKKSQSLRKAIKTTKNKLHQIGGAYFHIYPDYSSWIETIRAAQSAQDSDEIFRVCKKFMYYHSSTRERLEILDQFYNVILDGIVPIHSILDLACGFNPLAIPWMDLPEGVEYYAVDIYQDMIDFLGNFMALLPVNGYTKAADILEFRELKRFDVAFILKVIPCLEQIDKYASTRMLDNINATHLVISFPVSSLGGKEKGMVITYENKFYELVSEKNWEVKRLEFPTELVFVVKK